MHVFVPSYLFFPMLRRLFLTGTSAALAVGMAAPAFAYVMPGDFARPSNREVTSATQSLGYDRTTRRDIRDNNVVDDIRYRNRSILTEMEEGVRDTENPTAGKDASLVRGRSDRMLRRLNRRIKPGYDRYRILNLRPNTRYLRQLDEESSLPSSLVQTGGTSYDKPTRRDIRENMYFSQVDDRDRDVLGEMENNQR